MSNSSSAKMDRRFALGVASLRVYRVVARAHTAPDGRGGQIQTLAPVV